MSGYALNDSGHRRTFNRFRVPEFPGDAAQVTPSRCSVICASCGESVGRVEACSPYTLARLAHGVLNRHAEQFDHHEFLLLRLPYTEEEEK